MSSELRVKKLRGSGGYVIAALTDEQQSKASIGGPDLFLAPLCRMDTSKISKHLCNMCDKEYEGAPKVEYENPSEEVAPGLMLVEKGRYVCNACGTTIAEYREFSKEEVGQDGNAKTAAADTIVATPAANVEQAPDTSSVQSATTPEQIPTVPADVDNTPAAGAATETTAPPAAEQPQAATPPKQSVSAIEGRTVYDENASNIGTVKQIGINDANEMVIVIQNNDGTESAIPWSRVKKIGEVILLGRDEPSDINSSGTAAGAQPDHTPAQQADNAAHNQTQNPGKCQSCSFENKQGSKFCEECGARLS